MKINNLEDLRATEATMTDSERLPALLALAEELRERSPREALALATEGLDLAERLKDEHAIAKGMLLIGWMSLRAGDYHQALEQLGRARLLSEKVGDRTGVAKATGNIGSVYLRLGEYAKAMECYESALTL